MEFSLSGKYFVLKSWDFSSLSQFVFLSKIKRNKGALNSVLKGRCQREIACIFDALCLAKQSKCDDRRQFFKYVCAEALCRDVWS